MRHRTAFAALCAERCLDPILAQMESQPATMATAALGIAWAVVDEQSNATATARELAGQLLNVAAASATPLQRAALEAVVPTLRTAAGDQAVAELLEATRHVVSTALAERLLRHTAGHDANVPVNDVENEYLYQEALLHTIEEVQRLGTDLHHETLRSIVPRPNEDFLAGAES